MVANQKGMNALKAQQETDEQRKPLVNNASALMRNER